MLAGWDATLKSEWSGGMPPRPKDFWESISVNFQLLSFHELLPHTQKLFHIEIAFCTTSQE